MNVKKYFAITVFVFYMGLLGFLYLSIGEGKTYPAKPISIVIHSKPGSSIDYMARKVAKIALKYTDVAFVVENRPGTQGLVAMQHVLDMKADGYTLLGVTKSFLSTVMVNKSKVKLTDFLFIANMVSDPEALIANKARNFSTLKNIIDDANINKPQVWIGPGTGSRDHLMAMVTSEKLGVDIKWIDYKSGPQSILALLRNEAAIYVGNPADIKGKTDLNIVSIASNKRLELLPNIPTFVEQGYDLNESMWRGFAFKKGVPIEATEFVTGILEQVVNDPEWQTFCNDTYVFSDFKKQEQFTNYIHQEIDKTNFYLDKAGLLASYITESKINLTLVLLIIMAIVFVLLLGFNKFKISNINYDQYIAGGIISIAVFFYYQTLLFQIPDGINITNPALIPQIWIVILVVMSLTLIVKSKNKKSESVGNAAKTVFIIIIYLIIYLIAMQWVGYYITTPFFILATMYLLNYKNTAYMAINAFGFVLFSYFIFYKLLHIDLPLGWLLI